MNCIICGTKLKGKDLHCPKCKFDMSEEALPLQGKDPYQLRVFEPDYYVETLKKKFGPVLPPDDPGPVSPPGSGPEVPPGSGPKPKKHPLRWVAVVLLIGGVGLFIYDSQTSAVRNFLVQYPAFSFLNKEQTDIDDIDDSVDFNEDEVIDGEGADEEPIEDQLLDEDGIHYYEFFVDDVTWDEAFNDCISYGGYLARINTLDEFNSITSELDEEGLDDIHFFIGGRRNPDEYEYQWVDRNNVFTGVVITDSSYWTDGHWMPYEPSYKDGDTEEDVLCLSKYEGAWRLNDVPNNTLAYADFYSGKIGYICEYEE